MYIVVDKTSHAILHMVNSRPDETLLPEEVLPSFDPATMEFGRAADQFIPAQFTIKDGVVEDAAPPPPAPEETLGDARARVVRGFTAASLAARQAIVPDYQLANAGLGIYDDDRTALIRQTVQAFRDEVKRLEAAALKAKSIKDLDKIKPAFPAELVDTSGKGRRKTGIGLP